MKLRIALVSLAAAAGFAASFALASPPPGKGKHGSTEASTSSSTSSSTSTSTTEKAAKKTLVCHKTHSKKKPYVLLRVSSNAVASHLRHGDVLPTEGKCPAVAPPATTTSTTTTTGP